MTCCFGSTLDNPHCWTSWTVVATKLCRTACLMLTRMGSCRKARDTVQFSENVPINSSNAAERTRSLRVINTVSTRASVDAKR
jgi:hypothetical protein